MKPWLIRRFLLAAARYHLGYAKGVARARAGEPAYEPLA
jgi:hypothetical protein